MGNLGYLFKKLVLIQNLTFCAMKMRWLLVICGGMFIMSCTNDQETKVKIDHLGKKFDTAAEKLWDSTRQKAKELKQDIKEKVDDKNH